MSGEPAPDHQTRILHGSTVAFGPHGVLILGPSGSGKSSLALQLIGLGARLIADDQTRLSLRDGAVVAHAPERMAGVIEARGIGLIRVPQVNTALLRLLVDMGRVETVRMPPLRTRTLLGQKVELLWRVDGPHFASAICHLLSGGRIE